MKWSEVPTGAKFKCNGLDITYVKLSERFAQVEGQIPFEMFVFERDQFHVISNGKEIELRKRVAELEEQLRQEKESNYNNVGNADLQIADLKKRVAELEGALQGCEIAIRTYRYQTEYYRNEKGSMMVALSKAQAALKGGQS